MGIGENGNLRCGKRHDRPMTHTRSHGDARLLLSATFAAFVLLAMSTAAAAPPTEMAMLDLHHASAAGGIMAGAGVQARTEEMQTAAGAFCQGPATNMLHGLTFSHNRCLVFLFQSWVLDKRWKYILACIAAALMGIISQILLMWRGQCMTTRAIWNPRPRVALSAVLLLLSALLSYMLMMVAMTYDLTFICSILVGLLVGFLLSSWASCVGRDDRANQSGELAMLSEDPDDAQDDPTCTA